MGGMPVAILGLVTVILAGLAPADGHAITWQTNLASDNVVEISGEIDPQKTSLTKVVGITADRNVTDLRVRRFALAPVPSISKPSAATTTTAAPVAPSPAEIQPGDIKVTCPTALTRNEESEITIVVGGLTAPGEYRGEIDLFPAGAYAHALRLTLHVVVHQRPDVRAVDSARSFTLLACHGDCAGFMWLLPSSLAHAQGGDVRLDNQTAEPVIVDHTEVSLQSKTTATVLRDGEQIPVRTGGELPALRRSSIAVTFDPGKISAGRYEGSMRVWLKGVATPVIINLTADVRNGPLWAFIAIVSGVIAGRVIQWSSSPAAQARVALLQRIYRAREEVSMLRPAAAAETDLFGELDYAEQLLRLRTVRDEEIVARLSAVEAATALLLRLHRLRDHLRAMPPDDAVAKLLKDVDEAEERILAVTPEEVQALESQARKLPLPAASLSRLHSVVAATPDGKGSAVKQFGKKGFAQAAWFITGCWSYDAEINYFILRPLFFIALLAVLAFIGFYTLYVHGSSTLGADRPYDYLPLFLWGLTADVAQKPLQNVQQLVRT